MLSEISCSCSARAQHPTHVGTGRQEVRGDNREVAHLSSERQIEYLARLSRPRGFGSGSTEMAHDYLAMPKLKRSQAFLPDSFVYMVRPKRFELLTPWFVAKYSIQLSYGRVKLLPGGEGGIRTLDTSLSSYAPLAGACLRPLGHLSEGRA